MPKSCCSCNALESQDILFLYCATCKSAMYCSKACQRKDWEKQHKQICKLLNVGHGGMQVQTNVHRSRSICTKKAFEREELKVDEDGKRFFKLFQESTFEGSQAAALEMKMIAERQTNENQKFLLFQSMYSLLRSDSKMLSWPNSPFLVLLQFVDSNVLFASEETSVTMLHDLADLTTPSDYTTHENQLILAKQLIAHGANVNALSVPQGGTILHKACDWGNVTNLDFIELLLEEGADPNVKDHLGLPPLMATPKFAPGAAKFLLNWPTTDAHITSRTGATFQTHVRQSIVFFSQMAASPEQQFLLRQWWEIEKMLVERGATDPVEYRWGGLRLQMGILAQLGQLRD
jgi:hypothetical protein